MQPKPKKLKLVRLKPLKKGKKLRVKRRLNKRQLSRVKSTDYLLFIDPASISTGWALFKAGELVDSGTIAVDKKLDIWERLRRLQDAYSRLALPMIKEIHIESLPRSCHRYTHRGCTVIGVALRDNCLDIEDDIWITSWQRATRWKEREEGASEVEVYKGRVESEDELAAIAMGLYFHMERIEGAPGAPERSEPNE